MESGIKCLVFVVILISRITYIESYSNTDVKNLLTKLFTTNTYNKKVRPATDFSDATGVYLDVHLIALNDIDEVQEKMTTTVYLEVVWQDQYLNWTPAAYNGVEELYITQKDIWKPDFSLQNGFTKLKELGDDYTLTYVFYDGTVYWKPYEVFESKCTIDIYHFPFDKQSCKLEFGTWMIRLDDVDVDLGKKGLELDEYQPNDEWEILSTSAVSTESHASGAKVIFTINLKRNPRYYLLNIIVPVLFLSILVNFTFVIPVDSGEKMGYTMTVFLAFTVFLTIISSSLPVSSDPSILSMYLIFLLSIGTIIVMLTGLELRIHHRDPSRPVSKYLRYLVRLKRCLTYQNRCKKRRNLSSTVPKFLDGKELTPVMEIKTRKSIDHTTRTQHEHTDADISWSDVSAAIDFLCFFFFLFVNLIVTAVMLSYAYFSAM